MSWSAASVEIASDCVQVCWEYSAVQQYVRLGQLSRSVDNRSVDGHQEAFFVRRRTIPTGCEQNDRDHLVHIGLDHGAAIPHLHLHIQHHRVESTQRYLHGRFLGRSVRTRVGQLGLVCWD